MAKKEKTPKPAGDGDEAAPEAAAEAAAPKKGLLGLLKSKKMLMIGAPVLLLLLAGGGAGAYFFLIKGHGGKEKTARWKEAALTPPLVAFSDMQDILVNIQSATARPPISNWGVPRTGR